MTVRSLTKSMAVMAALAAAAPAQELVPGKPAPALHVAQWLKGEPVESFAAGRVYVVVFWATWSPDSLAAMPALSALQQQHEKELTAIAITAEDVSNPLEAVVQVVEEQGDRMAFTVAWDDDRKTLASWMRASELEGYPACFVVDKAGRIAWLGHPRWLGTILPDVLAGGYDLAKLGEKVADVEKRMMRIFLAAALKPEVAMKESAELLKQFPFLTEQVEAGLFELLLEGEGAKLAWPIGERLVARAIAQKDELSLNGIAWLIVDPEAERADRNLALAMKAATKAVELTEEKDGSILDTLARVHAWQKDYRRALELQKKAVAAAGDDEDLAESLRPAIAEYEAKLEEIKK